MFSIHLSLSEAEEQLKHLLPPEYITYRNGQKETSKSDVKIKHLDKNQD